MPQLRESKKRGLRDFFLAKAEREGSTVFHATYQEIADASGVSLGTVVKGLKVLETEGFIRIRKGPSRRVPNAYAVLTSLNGGGRTLGEELQEARQERDEAVRAAASLRSEVEAWRKLRASYLVREALPGDLVLAVYPRSIGEPLEARREEEVHAVKRLLDRRGIGAGLRRLQTRPEPERVEAFVRRVQSRIDSQIGPAMTSPAARRARDFIEGYVMPLAGASDVKGALARAQDAYEGLLASLRTDERIVSG